VSFEHESVLLEESVAALVTNPAGIYVDCTLGGAGHSTAIARLLNGKGRLIGIDQDPAALAAAEERLHGFACDVDIVQANFSQLKTVLGKLGIPAVDGVIFDLGVSSHQLDTAARGFSYMQNAPLDMRMNPEAPLSAADVVNTYSEDDLHRVIAGYGEERWARRIARFIVEARQKKPLATTDDLVQVIKAAIPAGARQGGPHPAKRTFQAIRIEVNGELRILKQAILDAVTVLEPGGRVVVITFHSLEDRIVKQAFQELAKGCICPPKLPVCVCNHQPEVRILIKGDEPTADEIHRNPRSRSAKLRVAEKR